MIAKPKQPQATYRDVVWSVCQSRGMTEAETLALWQQEGNDV